MMNGNVEEQDQEQGSPQNGGSSIVRTGLGAEVERHHETASSALAAASRAAIEAAYVMALKRPRSWDNVRTLLLKECERPGFAKGARYLKPVGWKRNEQTGAFERAFVEGLSIRFAEAAIRYMTNIYTHGATLYDDDKKVIVNQTVKDLESNVTYSQDITVPKTVERSKLKKGQLPIATRINSSGEIVYIVEATADEILNHTNALLSKALRNGVLRLLPGDIQDECEERCIKVAADKDAQDPTAARKQLLDGFAKIGIMPTQVQEYLGHDPGTLQPIELTQLRAIFSAIRDGETTWNEIMEGKAGGSGGGTPEGEKNGAAKAVDDLMERHKAKVEARKGKAKGEPSSDPQASGTGTGAGGAEPSGAS